jgi:3-oxoacyl-[acyl-carrier protein] reductase
MTTALPSPRVAIVTGAARGIGAAVAQRLATDGWAVGVLDLTEDSCADTVKVITGSGGAAVAVGADISSVKEAADAVERVASVLGSPSVLVNNAGITRDNLLFKMTEDDWDSVINVHLRGTFLMSRAVQKFMVETQWGRIVNLSSTSALGNRGQANYSAAKAGIQGLTKTLAIELGRFGITVNAIAPGFIQTEMTRATAARLGRSFEEFSAERAAAIPVRRPGRPEDVAGLVSYFVRDEASFVSGQVVYVAGGPKA